MLTFHPTSSLSLVDRFSPRLYISSSSTSASDDDNSNSICYQGGDVSPGARPVFSPEVEGCTTPSPNAAQFAPYAQLYEALSNTANALLRGASQTRTTTKGIAPPPPTNHMPALKTTGKVCHASGFDSRFGYSSAYLYNAKRSAQPDPHKPLSPYLQSLRWGAPRKYTVVVTATGKAAMAPGRLVRVIAARKRKERADILAKKARDRELQRQEDLLVCHEDLNDIIPRRTGSA